MSTKKRRGKRSHRKGMGKLRVNGSVRKDEVDSAPEHKVMMSHDSHHWSMRIDERDDFGSVTIYDAKGRITRVIAREQLVRPWAERLGNTWNNCLFPKRVSDKV